MRRLSSAGLLLGGLGLLSTAAALVGAALLTQQEQRASGVDRVTEAEPLPLMPGDAAEILERQVPRGSSAPSTPPRPGGGPGRDASPPATPPTRPQPTETRRRRVEPVEEEAYIVEGETLRRAVEEVEQTLSNMMPQVGAALSGPPGTGVRVSSEAGSATLDSQGFTVTDLDLRESFGLQVGDTIASVNGHPVDGPLSAWWIFQNLFLNHQDLREIRLEIYRSGEQLYKTYSIAGR